MGRGELRIYLGAAPGVGKTFAMLDEGFRRRDRGADVVVGYVETHGRVHTVAQLRDLEVVPRRTSVYRDVAFEEMDLDAILARKPGVALVDELAHTNAPGGRHAKRWEDVGELLDAGISVISTVNVQHLESLNDVVEAITGIRQRETVPDIVVRQAEQVELVDMTPEALRSRLAHGNVYPPEKIDPALSNYFRPGNLAALRELALLWVADRVDDSLHGYLEAHGIQATWETRERIVVAVSGAPGGAEPIRRAARMAARARADLIGVHVSSATGLRQDTGRLDGHRALLRDIGGVYHEVVDDVPGKALVAFARAERATQLVIGASARTRWQRLRRGSVIDTVLRQSNGLDVHVIAGGAKADTRRPVGRIRRRSQTPISVRRRVGGTMIGLVGLPVITVLFTGLRSRTELSTVVLAYLAVTVAATAVGGALPGLAVAIVAFGLENYYFVAPLHTFTVADPDSLVSLFAFLGFASVSSGVVQRLATRNREAERSRAEAAALARTAGNLAADADTLPILVDNLRTTFELDAVSLIAKDGDGWAVIASAGTPAPTSPTSGVATDTFVVDANTMLVLAGGTRSPDAHQLIGAFAHQAAAVLEARRLRREAADFDVMAQGDALRTGLLRSVSHDLRTPLAGIKASVTSLMETDVEWQPEQEREFLTNIDHDCDRLTRLVTNLLDASRLQSGAISPRRVPTSIDDVLAAALASLPSSGFPLDVDLPIDLPDVDTDPVLLERVLANLVSNAIRYSPSGQPVRIATGVVGTRVEILVIDRGPGIPPEHRSAALRPFQRLGDEGTELGVGLGLAVAHGFTEQLGGELRLETTPGGGLTVAVNLPRSGDT